MTLALIDDAGFSRKNLDEIKDEVDQNVIDTVGPVNTGADAVVGQYNGSMSEAFNDLCELVEDCYNSMYPATATGVSLDGAVSFVGMERKKASYTIVTATIYGTDGISVPAGSLAETSANQQYELLAEATISKSNAVDAIISVITVQNNTLYQVVLGTSIFSYTSDADATEAEILAGLAGSVGEATATVVDNTLRVTSSDGKTGKTLTVTSNLMIDEFGSPALFRAVEIGLNPLPLNALINIVTAVSGWDKIDNLASASQGTNAETDDELYLRFSESNNTTGKATSSAIYAGLLAISGVTKVTLYENNSNFIDEDGLTPHTIEAVVQGGLDAEIATELYNNLKGASVQLAGNTSEVITDVNGDSVTSKFSRPVNKYIWLDITLTEYDEETLPTNYEDITKTASVAYGNALDVGIDVILKRFYGPIFDAVSGLSDIVIEAAITDNPGDTPSYGTTNIPIGRDEESVFDTSRVTVTLA